LLLIFISVIEFAFIGSFHKEITIINRNSNCVSDWSGNPFYWLFAKKKIAAESTARQLAGNAPKKVKS